MLIPFLAFGICSKWLCGTLAYWSSNSHPHCHTNTLGIYSPGIHFQHLFTVYMKKKSWKLFEWSKSRFYKYRSIWQFHDREILCFKVKANFNFSTLYSALYRYVTWTFVIFLPGESVIIPRFQIIDGKVNCCWKAWDFIILIFISVHFLTHSLMLWCWLKIHPWGKRPVTSNS